ncbi:hypothetical protein AALP_AAs48168U000100, partial [Arabis alpina]
VYGIPTDRIYVTYFEGDEKAGLEPDNEARDIWLRFLPSQRVLPFGCKDNFWEMGDTGPCGPCSEIHYDLVGDRDAASLVNKDDPTCLEIWNLVFIQFNRESKDGSLKPLPAKHVDTGMGFERLTSILQNKMSNYDTGMGFERLTSILQNKMSNYDTDVFVPIFDDIRKATGARPYSGKLGMDDVDRVDTAYRVIADHIRTLSIAIADESRPGNEGREHVLRRILRRAVRFGTEILKAEEGFFSRLVSSVTRVMGDVYPELKEHEKKIIEIIEEEEAAFCKTLKKVAFDLWSTHGFPLDLTQLMAEEQGLSIDVDDYNKAMEESKDISRHTQKNQGDVRFLVDVGATSRLLEAGVTATDDSFKYTWFQDHETEVKAVGDNLALVLASTSFYAEQGGQTFDTGVIEGSFGTFEVCNVQTSKGFVFHFGSLTSKTGKVLVGDKVTCKVDYERRKLIAPNHTCTHMLNFALKKILGDGKPVDPNDLLKIELVVKTQIKLNLDVFSKKAPLYEAKRIKGLREALGEASYDPVRVVAIGRDVEDLVADLENNKWLKISSEFCGGTHITNTCEAKAFVIVSEEGVGSDTRRITALTGQCALDAIDLAYSLKGELYDALIAEEFELEEKVNSLERRCDEAVISPDIKAGIKRKLVGLQNEVRKAQKKRAQLNLKRAVELATEAAESATSEGKTFCVVKVDIGLDIVAVRAAVLQVMEKKGMSIMVLSADETTNKVDVCAGVPEKSDQFRKLDVIEWFNTAMAPINGKGKGKDKDKDGRVSGQGMDASQLDAAFDLAVSFASLKL